MARDDRRATSAGPRITCSMNALSRSSCSDNRALACSRGAEGDLAQKMVLEIDGKSVAGEFLRI